MKSFISHYTHKRYKVYACISFIVLVLPFIRINDKHFFLLSFDHKKLDFLFISFNSQELYLLPFLLIILFLGVFFITTLAGRIWCGWSCPQTIFRVVFRDLIQTKLLKIRTNTNNKQRHFEGKFFRKILAIVLFYIIALIAVSNFLWYFVPPEDFFAYIQNPSEHLLLIGILFIASLLFVFDICFLQENFCIYVCPYARIQSVMFDNHTMQVIYDEKRGGQIFKSHQKLHKRPPVGECIGCEACVSVCPTHIDIRAGMQLECINCLECADACSKIQDKFKRPSLINWSSAEALEKRQKIKYFRFKTIAYALALLIILSLLVLMSAKKEHMLLNINRSSELYSIEQRNGENIISNSYVFLFQNTDNKTHEYYFKIELENRENALEIVRPTKPFSLKAGASVKQIVVLKALENLSTQDEHDSILNLKITAFAVDDPENIVVERQSIFVYPKPIQKQ